MRIINKTIYCFIIVFLIGTRLDAQTNPVYREVEKNRKAITKGRREVKPNFTIVEPFVDLGYDDSTLARLKKVGADIERLYELNPTDWNSKVRAAISDCIVIATVTEKESFFNAPVPFSFRTIARLKVEEFLRNDFNVPASDLQVVIHSGGHTTEVGEDTLIKGERYLLFLSARGFLNEVEYNDSKKMYQKMITDPTVRFMIICDIDGEYRIRNGSMMNRISTRNLQDTKDEISAVVNAVFPKRR